MQARGQRHQLSIIEWPVLCSLLLSPVSTPDVLLFPALYICRGCIRVLYIQITKWREKNQINAGKREGKIVFMQHQCHHELLNARSVRTNDLVPHIFALVCCALLFFFFYSQGIAWVVLLRDALDY